MNRRSRRADTQCMDLTDEEIARRLREAKELSHARSKPLPRTDHVADSLTFEVVDAGVEMVRTALTWLGAGALVVIAVVLLLAKG